MNLRPTAKEYDFKGFYKKTILPSVREEPKNPKIYNPNEELRDEDIWPGYDKWASDEEEYDGPGYSWMTDEDKMELYGYTGKKDYKTMDYKEITYNTYNEIKEIKSILLDIKEVLSQRGEL